jgi:hypothetical protein
LYDTTGATGVGGAGIANGNTIAIYYGFNAGGTDYGAAGLGSGDSLTYDPSFSNISATAASWDVYLGGPGSFGTSHASVFQNMIAMNGADINGNPTTFNKAYTTANFLAYIRHGYVAYNGFLKNWVQNTTSCTNASKQLPLQGCDPGAQGVFNAASF